VKDKDAEGGRMNQIKVDAVLAQMIDHTILRPDAAMEDIKRVCEEAKHYHFASVCVNSWVAAFASKQLEGSGIKTCSVVGFPFGATSTQAKVEETRCAVDAGAHEIDMVINLGALKSEQYETVRKDIAAVVDAAGVGVVVKVIIETCLLSREEKVIACRLAQEAGASFVKTSTGFSTGGATTEDVALMRRTVGDKMGVKASGGIRSREQALELIRSGANRIGASASAALVKL